MKSCEPFITPDCQACSLQNVVGISKQIFSCLKKAGMILNNDEPVLITGESGTGKELFARALHYSDCCKRRLEPFITKNCSGIDSGVLSSELFGQENDGDNGVKKEFKPSLFEAAQGGTLFLDEIGDISMDTQKALLRIIEEKRLYRVGGREKQKINVRIVAATNKNLKKMVVEGRFRRDLYHRLNVFNMSIPPIRERKDDILPLVYHILDRLAERDGVKHYGIKIKVLKSFVHYDWPGNVRELENCLLGAVSYLPAGQTIIDSVPENVPRTTRYQRGKVMRKTYSAGEKSKGRVVLKPLWAVRKDAVITTLRACGGNRQEAAEILQISRNTLYRMIEKYDISEKDYLR